MTKQFVFVTFLSLCLWTQFVQSIFEREASEQWDLLIFTQQWPVTVCKEWTDHNPSHKCAMPKDPDSWTIHGIWPTKLGTIGPEFCNRTWHFDPEVIRPIETSLSQYWVGVEAGSSIYGLWAHEWTKHGTCAAVLEPLNSELKYFSQGLQWIYSYSMINILKEAGITPSDVKTYPISSIHDAIVKKLGVNPAIECRHEEKKNWLVELRICFDKQLQLVDCDGVLQTKIMIVGNTMKSIITNCDTSKEIVYPQTMADTDRQIVHVPPNYLLIHLYKLLTWIQWFTL